MFTVEGVVCVVASHLGDLTPLAALTLNRLFNLNSMIYLYRHST